MNQHTGEVHPIEPIRQPGSFEVALNAIADGFKPLIKAYVEAGKWLMETLATAGITSDDLREQQAMKYGRRYWEDTKHRVRRTSGRTPLIHNGKKAR